MKRYVIPLIFVGIIVLGVFTYWKMIPYEYQDLKKAIQEQDSQRINTITKQVEITPAQRKKSIYTLYQMKETKSACQLLNRSVMEDELFWQETISSAPIEALKCLDKKNMLFQIDSNKNNPLHLTTSFNVEQKRWKYILGKSKQSSINQCNAMGESPLTSAARLGNINAVKDLLNQGANIKKCDNSAMQVAIEQNNREMFDLLRKNGGSISKKKVKEIVERTGATFFKDVYSF